ncbi:MAG: DUF3943 domain-containing protein, partial [Archangium sp.]
MHRAGVLVALQMVAAGPPALADEHSGREDRSDAPLASPGFAHPEKHPWLVLVEVTAINGVTWGFDHFVLNKDWARVSTSTWAAGLGHGFEWDDDDFATNQFLHPYHGSLYANAARDNGFGYWEAGLFTLVASLQWEFFAENDPPAANDLINTSLGGSAMGEVLYRLSSLALDNGATGGERVRRELVAGLLSPVRGFNRLLRGDAWRLGPTPPEWRPSRFVDAVSGGWLKVTNVDSSSGGQNELALDVD